jgi:predicted glycosyltransferase
MIVTKRILFFIVHPSKYYVFRHTINILKSRGHHVDILITSKDVLEDLIKCENWDYINIFPEGRKINWLPTLVGASINSIRTLYRIEKFLFTNNKYNLFITDDLLALSGKWHGVPTIMFQDDDVNVVPETAILHMFASYILAPSVTNMGKSSKKKIPFYGYKELGSFHPMRFKPDKNIIKKFNPKLFKYFLLRLVSLRSTHDVGKCGLTNDDVEALICVLEKYGKVCISSERTLPLRFEKYRINIEPNEIAHALYFAEFIISDSQTMSAEAAVLGTPYIRYNDFVGKISSLNELEKEYGLGYGILTKNKNELFLKVNEMLADVELSKKWQVKRDKMLSEKIDLTAFMVWLFEDYPESVDTMFRYPNYQLRFK